jgi:hypothetical protein
MKRQRDHLYLISVEMVLPLQTSTVAASEAFPFLLCLIYLETPCFCLFSTAIDIGFLTEWGNSRELLYVAPVSSMSPFCLS